MVLYCVLVNDDRK